MKREQDKEGRTYRRTRLQRVVTRIIVNEEPINLLLESVGDYSLPNHLQHLYQDTYDCEAYRALPFDIPFTKYFK